MLRKIGLGFVYSLTAAFGVFFLIALIGSIYQLSVYPTEPTRVTLAEAVQMDANNEPIFLFVEKPLYMTITDAKWECASVTRAGYRKNKHTDGVFTDKNNTAIVFVQVKGHYTCQELQSMTIAGELQSFVLRPVTYQSDTNGLILIEEGSNVITLSLCTHCNPGQAWFYVIFFLAFPFMMWAIFSYGKRQQSKQQSLSN